MTTSWQRLAASSSYSSESDQAVDLVDQAVDLAPVTAPALVVVARKLHVHRRSGEHGLAGSELVELVVAHD
jgi:hypothetical protein